MIELKNITKAYHEHVLFKDFSYLFEKGKMYAIVGTSGCGKTTLLNMIGLLEKQTSGDIIIDNVTNCNPTSSKATVLRRNKISYLFQNYALVEDKDIRYNLLFSLKYVKRDNKEKEMLEALEKVNIHKPLTTKIHELSGGQQQRVALARLLLKPSDIILCDEPTGNLDKENAAEIVSLLQMCAKDGKLVIIATHDQEVASLCDKQIEL